MSLLHARLPPYPFAEQHQRRVKANAALDQLPQWRRLARQRILRALANMALAQ